MKKLQIARYGYILISIIFYIAGITYMVLSGISPLTLCIVSGIILIIYGAIKIIGYLSNDLYNLAFQYDLGCGMFLIVLGIIALVRNEQIINYLSIGLGVLILLDSFLKIQTSRDAKVFGLETWNRILGISILAGVFGILAIVRPFENEVASHIITGCALLFEGFMNQCVVHYTVRKKDVFPQINDKEND
ncbi:MAG: DUF308 domain-containing protein [Faecalibacillus sp.]